MKKYSDFDMLTWEDKEGIIKRGGDALAQLNADTRKHLDSMKLSQRAQDIINTTDCLAEVFGFLDTAEEVERFIQEEFSNED